MKQHLAGVSKRQHEIMEVLRQFGTVAVDSLSETMNVTPQTIRRDLNSLFDAGHIQRVHGGAILKDSVENMGYRARKTLMIEEKDAIARIVAKLIPDHASLFINIGTTTEQVARHLADKTGILVVTNNMNVASALWPMSNIQVMVASGMIRHSDGGIVGSSTEKFIEQFKVDYAVIGCSAIDSEGEVLDYDVREVCVAKAIIRHARSVILVTDSMKFERKASIRICNLSDVDYLVTDSKISKKSLHMCESRDVHLQVVSISDETQEGLRDVG
ncbi:MAG: DeoR/GlpR transcriptional regulator [Desulfobacterales bacterium]|nr:DeoR/GlpR transcriptional regulator [Desulfobacterales bacterium]